MKCSTVFDRNIEAFFDRNETLIVNQGGTRSGKTYSIMQLLFLVALGSEKKLIISVCSYALPHLKLGAMRELENIITDYEMIVSDVKNISDSTFYIGNSIIEFFGTDNIGKVHGPARDILFVNECNYIKKEVYEQLAIRTRGAIFLDFNPTREFWFHTEIQGKQKHCLIKSTYLDNDFLTAAQIERIEAKKHNKQWWKVYGEGELGQLEDAILTNWSYGEFDSSLPFGFGLDFGFKDPDAMIRSAVNKKEKKIYWKEELYKDGLSTGKLGQIVKSIVDNKLVIADSAAARTIADLKGQGINIKGVVKGKITDDIKMLWDYEIIVDPESFNLARELNSWVWLDKKGEIPIDEDNHLIDAGRYYSRTVIKPFVKRPRQKAL